MEIIGYLSLGSQLVKTVRSLLSLILSHGMSSSSADKDMAFTLSSRLNTLEDGWKPIKKTKIKHLNWQWNSVPKQLFFCVCCEYFLTYQLQGTGPAASSQCGPGQIAANDSTCFWEQWTQGSSQTLHTYKPGWYTLRSGGSKVDWERQIKGMKSQATEEECCCIRNEFNEWE